MSVNSRRKGIKGELEACKLFKPYFPDVRRSFGQARKGYEQPDLIGGIEKYFYVEVKRTKNRVSDNQIYKWSRKAIEDAKKFYNDKETHQIILVFRADRDEWGVWQFDTDDQWKHQLRYWDEFKNTLPAVPSPTKKMGET